MAGAMYDISDSGHQTISTRRGMKRKWHNAVNRALITGVVPITSRSFLNLQTPYPPLPPAQKKRVDLTKELFNSNPSHPEPQKQKEDSSNVQFSSWPRNRRQILLLSTTNDNQVQLMPSDPPVFDSNRPVLSSSSLCPQALNTTTNQNLSLPNVIKYGAEPNTIKLHGRKTVPD